METAETGTSGAGGVEQGQQSEQAPEWASRLGERMDKLTTDVQGLRGTDDTYDGEPEQYSEHADRLEEYSDEELDAMSDEELAAMYDDEPDDEDDDEPTDDSGTAEGVDLMRQIAQQVHDENQSPRDEAAAMQRRDAEAEALEQTYPKMQEPEFASQLLRSATQAAQELARAVGDPEIAEALIKEPTFIEKVYLAQEAQEASEREASAGSRGIPFLESSGGAAPMSADDEDKLTDEIVNARGHRAPPALR